VDKNSIIKAISFVLSVLVILVVGWSAFKAVTEVSAAKAMRSAAFVTLDTDSSLAITIDSLEANWQRRVAYKFGVKQDPLYLGRVLANFSYARAGYRESVEDMELRLSATVIDDNPKAIIKYRGKSNVVRPGDSLGDGYVVKEIREKTVILSRGGVEITLKNMPLPRETTPEEGAQYNEPDQW